MLKQLAEAASIKDQLVTLQVALPLLFLILVCLCPRAGFLLLPEHAKSVYRKVWRNTCEGSGATYAKGLRLAREQTEEASMRALLQATRKQLVNSEDNTKEIEREFKVPPLPSPPLRSRWSRNASSGLACCLAWAWKRTRQQGLLGACRCCRRRH